jgi:hypothetical protein
MNEWERSLTPSPGLVDKEGDYLGRAVSPAGSLKEVKAGAM